MHRTSNMLVQMWHRWRESKARHETYMALSHPEHSKLAWGVNIVIILTILVSIVTFCVETLPVLEDTTTMDALM